MHTYADMHTKHKKPRQATLIPHITELEQHQQAQRAALHHHLPASTIPHKPNYCFDASGMQDRALDITTDALCTVGHPLLPWMAVTAA